MKERDLKAEQENELRKKAIQALEEHYQEIADQCNFNADIPGYVVVAYIDSVGENLMLDIYKVKEVIKCYKSWKAKARVYLKEKQKQGRDELDFDEALYETRGEWFDRELYGISEYR